MRKGAKRTPIRPANGSSINRRGGRRNQSANINTPSKMKAIKFEKRNKEVSKVASTINYIANTANTKQEAVNRLADVLSKKIKLGWG